MPVMGERLYDRERQKHEKSEPPAEVGGKTRIDLNNGRTSAVKRKCGFGADTVVLPKSPGDCRGSTRNEERGNTNKTTVEQR
jgi:hypothetical protein